MAEKTEGQEELSVITTALVVMRVGDRHICNLNLRIFIIVIEKSKFEVLYLIPRCFPRYSTYYLCGIRCFPNVSP